MSQVESESASAQVNAEIVSSELPVAVPAADATVADSPTNSDAECFRAFGLSSALIQAVESSGYTTPTPIQAQTIELLLAGRDVLAQAQTGTGKTAAFALPLLDRVDVLKRKPQVLVLTPTRELAIQVAKSFEKYARRMPGLKVLSIYGGQDYQVQLRPLSRGVHIVVGTPGRVMDHMRRGSLKLDDLQCLVLDEADEMLRMGFADDVDWVLTQAPEKRQMALFSATIPKPIREIAQKHLHQPAQVTIAQKTATADTVNQRYIVASPRHKQAALARLLEAEPIEGVIVFVKLRSTTGPLAEYLANAGHNTAALNGDVAQKQRERIVEKLRSGEVNILVATDVAARGLDVQRVSHVINYDLPHDSEAYIHRIGRTGRAGRSGEAILFLHPRERRLLTRLEQATRHTIKPMELPSNRDVNKQRVARFHDRITAGLSHKELETFQSIVQQYQRENDVPIEMIAASLAVLANREKSLLVKGELKQVEFATDSRREPRDRYAAKKSHQDRGNSSPKTDSRTDENMQTFRIEVGRSHHVQPGNIVGAIANQAGLGGDAIGRIQIYDRFSTVDLPHDTPRHVLDALQDVAVGGQKLRISQMDGASRPKTSGYKNKQARGKKPKKSRRPR